MNGVERQFLLTAAWMFMRHGRRDRARSVCEALCEDRPRDGVAAAALAEIMLSDGEPARAVEILRAAEFPRNLAYAQAVLETRALRLLGRGSEARSRWARYLEFRKGASRQWVG